MKINLVTMDYPPQPSYNNYRSKSSVEDADWWREQYRVKDVGRRGFREPPVSERQRNLAGPTSFARDNITTTRRLVEELLDIDYLLSVINTPDDQIPSHFYFRESGKKSSDAIVGDGDNLELMKKKRVIIRKKKNVTMEEFYIWLSTYLQVCLIQTRTLNELWSTDPTTMHPRVSKRMGRDRFRYIWSRMKLLDPVTWTNKLAENFKKLWKPQHKLGQDETMFPYLGSDNPYHAFIPRKPHPNGTKAWGLVDSAEYFYHASLYTKEKETTTETTLRICSELPKLVGGVKPTYIIYLDKLFGSLKTAEQLKLRGFDSVMSCRVDRPGWLFKPLESLVKSGREGEMFARRIFALDLASSHPSHTIAMTALAQKRSTKKGRDGYYLSTAHGGEERVTVTMTLAQGEGQSERVRVRTDKLRADYMKNYGHEDRADRRMMEVAFGHKFGTWQQSVISGMISMALVCNGRVLWNTLHVDNRGGRAFNAFSFYDFLSESLYPVPLPLERYHDIRKAGKRGTCAICYKYGQRKLPVHTYCTGCSTHMHKECFETLHHEYVCEGGFTKLKKKKRNFHEE